jgi:integral membrane protein (TIGR01906 family)
MFERRGEADLGLLRILLVGALILTLPVALITTTVRAFISEQAVYEYSVRAHDAERVSGIDEDELIAANEEIRDYLVQDDPPPLAPVVHDERGEEAPLFSAKETAHMVDVRNLVQTTFTVQLLSVAMVLGVAVVLAALWPVRVLAAGALYGAVLTGALIGATALLGMTGFDGAWSNFHGIAFTNDLWQLDPDTDHLIQMYPEAFWFEATMAIGLLVLAQATLIALVSAAFLLISRERRQEDEVVRPVPALPGREGHARLTPPNPRHYVR